MLVNGKWLGRFSPIDKASDEEDQQGSFVRQGSQFRHWVGRSEQFPVEPGRYHLYVSMICPWACRTLMMRSLKGLESVISVSRISPVLSLQGWTFDGWGSDPDPHINARFMHQLYTHAEPHYSGRATVPVLWDKKQQTIVNNESADIMQMFNGAFSPLAESKLELRPESLCEQIDRLSEHYYNSFNNGVYRAGFAQSQQAYQEAATLVFESLAELEGALSGQPYRLGDQVTELDIRLFVTLVRFELAYYSLFKCNLRPLQYYPSVCRYIQRIYRLPGIAQTVDAEAIKRGYYSIEALNPTGIVPIGPAQPCFLA
ncbi:MAG: glutathione S-transferase C-terminal domain-containing protein [Halopseudomonas sp.]